MNLAPGLVVADRFKLVRLLGQGGMGAVWLAEHTGLDVPCAVKFIHPHAAESVEIRQRFEREAKAAAQLRSPHVVQVLDHGVWEGSPYIAMEFLEGEDLAHRLHVRRVLSPPEVAGLAAQVGRALQKAHQAGLVHRDLKPANIFLVKDDDREIAKVLDFGVAKATLGADGNTKTGAVLGTPYYMSPEQARGMRDVDHRSDLWALSVLVFQSITGQLPFMADGFGDLLVKIIIDPIPVPSTLGPVPPGFDAWWAKASQRDPAQRFQSAKELTEALSIALGVTVPAGGMAAAGDHGTSGLIAAPYPGGPITGGMGMVGTPMPQTSTPMPQGSTPMPGPQGTSQGGISQPGTPLQQAISVAQPPPKSKLPLVLAVAVVGGVGLGVAGWALSGSGKGGATHAGPATTSATPTVTATATAAPTPTPTAAPTATPTAAPAATAEPTAAPTATPTVAATTQLPLPPKGKGPMPGPTATAKPAPTGKAKTDFGI